MSDKAQQLFEEAMQANLSGDTSRATDLLRQVVNEEPENLAAWEALSQQLTDPDERRRALTTVLQLDPDNEYAKNALESLDKSKRGAEDRAELIPGIPMRQARTVGIGLVVYTLLVCGATLFITTAIGNNKAARAQEVAQGQAFQTQTQDSILLAATQAVLTATQQALDANATLLAQVTATPTTTPTRAFSDLPTEIPPTPTPTEVSFLVEATPPPLPGRILTWGGRDVRSQEYLPLRAYSLNTPGTSEDFTIGGQREIGRNPLITLDNTTTVFEQWRQDAPRLYMSSLEAITPGGTLDALVSNQFLIVNLRDPGVSRDAKRVAFIATDYNTQTDGAYVADLTNPAFTKVYKLSQDAASYTAITLSPDGTQAVAVRVDNGSTDLVVFDLTTLASLPAPATPLPVGEGTPTAIAPTVPPPTIPLRPLTTDGNTLVEGSPSFSPDGTRIVYEAASSGAANNRDLYIVTVGAAPGTPQPIMTTDGNDIFPSFSPDGNMVVFASDRQTGIYNLFIYDTLSRVTYQLSAEPQSVYPGSWVN